MTRLVALPMYDLPELHPETDALFDAIARSLRHLGIEGVPDGLERGLGAPEIWRDSRLLLAQSCGYPLVTTLSHRVRVVATPSYRAPGCGEGTYASVVMVRSGDYATLRALRGARVAVNALDSHSGMNALRALVAPLAVDGRFFSDVVVTGSHRASLAAVRDSRADVAAVDAVTLALLGDVAAGEIDGLEVLGWTDDAPCLPLITGGATRAEELVLLRTALARVADDPRLAETLARLRLRGFAPAELDDYRPIVEMELAARKHGYPVLG